MGGRGANLILLVGEAISGAAARPEYGIEALCVLRKPETREVDDEAPNPMACSCHFCTLGPGWSGDGRGFHEPARERPAHGHGRADQRRPLNPTRPPRPADWDRIDRCLGALRGARPTGAARKITWLYPYTEGAAYT